MAGSLTPLDAMSICCPAVARSAVVFRLPVAVRVVHALAAGGVVVAHVGAGSAHRARVVAIGACMALRAMVGACVLVRMVLVVVRHFAHLVAGTMQRVLGFVPQV